jgi:hypothetical protein
VRDLGRRVERQAVAPHFGDRTARFNRAASRPLLDEAALDEDLGLGEPGVDVAAADRPLVRLVGAELLPDERGAVLERLLRVDDDRLGVVLDDDLLGSINDRVSVSADDDRDRVADVLDLVALQWPVLGRPHLDPGWGPDHRERRREVVREVLACERGDDVRVLERAGGVDRDDARVRLG